MAFVALLKYKNIDSTIDINNRFSNLFEKGIGYGGIISAAYNYASQLLSVTLSEIAAVSKEGMVVTSDGGETISTGSSPSKEWILFLVAQYVEGGDPNISLGISQAAVYVSDDTRINIGTINVDGFGAVTYDYSAADRIDPVSRNTFRGAVATNTDLPGTSGGSFPYASPQASDCRLLVTGDLFIIKDTFRIYAYTRISDVSGVWEDAKNTTLETILANHRGNWGSPVSGNVASTHEYHLTLDQFNAIATGNSVPTEITSGINPSGNTVMGSAYPQMGLAKYDYTISTPSALSYTIQLPVVTPASAESHMYIGKGASGTAESYFHVCLQDPVSGGSTLAPIIDAAGVEVSIRLEYAGTGAHVIPSLWVGSDPLDAFGYFTGDTTPPVNNYFSLVISGTSVIPMLAGAGNLPITIYYGKKLDFNNKLSTDTYTTLESTFEMKDLLLHSKNFSRYILYDTTALPEHVVDPLSHIVTQAEYNEALDQAIYNTGLLPDSRDMPTGASPYMGWTATQVVDLSSGNHFFRAVVDYTSGRFCTHFDVQDRGQLHIIRNTLSADSGSIRGAAVLIDKRSDTAPISMHKPGLEEGDTGFEYMSGDLRQVTRSYTIELAPRQLLDFSGTPGGLIHMYPPSSGTGSTYISPRYNGDVFSAILGLITVAGCWNGAAMAATFTGGILADETGNLIFDEINSIYYRFKFVPSSTGAHFQLYNFKDSSVADISAFYAVHDLFNFEILSPHIIGNIIGHETSPTSATFAISDTYQIRQLLNMDDVYSSGTSPLGTGAHYGLGTLYTGYLRDNPEAPSGIGESLNHAFMVKGYPVKDASSVSSLLPTGWKNKNQSNRYASLRMDGVYKGHKYQNIVQKSDSTYYGRPFTVNVSPLSLSTRWVYAPVTSARIISAYTAVLVVSGAVSAMSLCIAGAPPITYASSTSNFNAAEWDTLMFHKTVPLLSGKDEKDVPHKLYIEEVSIKYKYGIIPGATTSISFDCYLYTQDTEDPLGGREEIVLGTLAPPVASTDIKVISFPVGIMGNLPHTLAYNSWVELVLRPTWSGIHKRDNTDPVYLMGITIRGQVFDSTVQLV